MIFNVKYLDEIIPAAPSLQHKHHRFPTEKKVEVKILVRLCCNTIINFVAICSLLLSYIGWYTWFAVAEKLALGGGSVAVPRS